MSQTTSEKPSIENVSKTLVELGSMWACYGLSVGRAALETSARSLNGTATLLGQIAGMVTLSSEAFIVRVIGAYGLSRCAVQAVIVIGENGPVIRKIERYPFFDAALRWGWTETADTELVLVENN